MSASQDHGFQFEQWITDEVNVRLGDRRPPAIRIGYTARFDIPGWKDPKGEGLPSSIKMAGQSRNGKVTVYLADARRIVGLGDQGKTRLLVGVFKQLLGRKVVEEVREYTLTPEFWQEASGQVPLSSIEAFHEAIKLADHREARRVAKVWKEKLAVEYPGLLQWAPKIDSKNQRRLQCSIKLHEMDALVETLEGCKVERYGVTSPERDTWSTPTLISQQLWQDGPSLPLVLDSGPRVRHAKSSDPDMGSQVGES